ncbi:LuxR C-terminal-related transcriptional regulator [Streptomyces sp. NPDC047017]|uniref:helix-turn-helix transcriptional regulator n=1 Tax=Streptomyces sp. NPDC047017 TaxID=3155024 RepID=UPI0033E22EC0
MTTTPSPGTLEPPAPGTPEPPSPGTPEPPAPGTPEPPSARPPRLPTRGAPDLAAVPAGRARRVLRAVAVAACLPYLCLKALWIGGSHAGVPAGSPLLGHRATTIAVNGGTVLMDSAVIVLALLLTRPWGLRGQAAPPPWVGRLTGREGEVLRLMAAGLANAEIARRMEVGPATVKTHVAAVLAKTGARDRTQAVIAAYEAGFMNVR